MQQRYDAHALGAPPAEIGQVARSTSRPHDAQHRLHEHPVIATRRTARPLAVNDVARHPLLLLFSKINRSSTPHDRLTQKLNRIRSPRRCEAKSPHFTGLYRLSPIVCYQK